MVTADNLGYDILALIFLYLRRDQLVSVTLVSRAFCQGALPHLYHTLVYRIAHKKKYPKMMTPFQTILLHPNLAVHVRCCELYALPFEKGVPRCDFMSQCVSALEKSPNLTGFYCTPNVLPSFISLLPQKDRLVTLHVNAALTPSQTDILTQITGLQKLRLDNASWCVVHALPKWIENLKDTLTSLSIQLSNELNKTVLRAVLASLPSLTCLHVRSCPKIDHATLLGLVANNVSLEELSFTTWESMNGNRSANLKYINANLYSLKSLTIDTRNLIPVAGPAVWSSIIALTRKSNAPLQNLSLQLCENATLQMQFVDELLTAHADTLTTLRLTNCTLPSECLEKICKKCVNLEKLQIAIPGKVPDILSFARALASSKSLRTLVEETEHHRTPDPQLWLDHRKVRALMERAVSLRKLISDRRCWMGDWRENGKYHLSFTTLPRSTLQVM